ncbi:MAG: tRNA (adenosine(37)-N6)-threonylcarbamoyltransferase complex dimerization subunit type 1 TsaB [Muribaculaceae bacterium]|jgi:tRNA threonylcarbamoyladenosine biosynthesis protein TsaB|nr:tRNA (adenosine(37)-N6)-threonylcarbamoyltransferase complex dimerization subunit type 1 TsaB [Muribaculaceae bacterium]MBQ5723892.1 tRNA (adenosine(37)-N6)-threonylcarbamoyltransferase complex dimerization subunit type 1 TsaB [Muribaculaceae bacterium]MBR4886057.1 tRNA (adenosine(37)-N6)-threonylcarbamoyltransferase complex dimerization subunit type 1 TsaB [Muribaculaceae bacterium]MEE1365936.1 tRNA (adenosine(37)-N6)-threonylcarbamoyltransferase complex dimerization subunit type 1 TsaB [Mur
MAVILNIETSAQMCSVALSEDGAVVYKLSEQEGMNHAKALAPFVDECIRYAEDRNMALDAVAVSIGPGSYTGLRIGLSTAKGICFAKNIPLIGVSTLKIMAVSAMFKSYDWEGDEILVPMLDARRMEAFTAVYDFALNAIIEPHAKIFDSESFSDLLQDKKVFFMGNCCEKVQEVIKSPNAKFMHGIVPNATDMLALSEKAFRNNDFLDLAYSVPEYLKEYQTTTPKNKI